MYRVFSFHYYPTSVGAVSLAAWSRFPCPTISRSQVWKVDAHKFLLEFLDIKNTRRSVNSLAPLPTDFRLCLLQISYL
jgi:cytolysin (calcineurin-like family phosphatase)